jgi:hypothetical protein
MVAESDPFERDPALIERALRSHAATQNALADFLTNRSIDPRSPSPLEPNVDPAWLGRSTHGRGSQKHPTLKRRTATAVGPWPGPPLPTPVDHRGQSVRAVVVTSERPSDDTWLDLLRSHDVGLTWPGNFDYLFLRPPA